MGRLSAFVALVATMLIAPVFSQTNAAMPLFEAHMHDNIEARSEYPPDKVLEIFKL